MITDMTEGNIPKTLAAFTFPMLVSVMFQQIYNIADSMIAGRFVGEGALAAIGASYPITMLFMAVAVGCNIGCSVVISQLFGGRRFGELKTAVTTTLLSSLGLSLLLTGAGLPLCGLLLEGLNTPGNIFADAGTYLGIYTGGLAFLFLYNVCTGIFTALGDSRTPLYFLIGSSVGNILLDLLLVTVIPLGVAGVAWATFIAQGAACVLSGLTLFRRLRQLPAGEPHQLFSLEMLGRIARVAVPSILQQSFISVGNLCVQVLINGYGSAAIAGYSAAVKLNTFAITSMTTLGNGVSSFTAQNLGAGKPERVRRGLWTGVVLAGAVSLLFFGACFFGSRELIGLFLEGGSREAAEVGRQFLRIVAPFYPVIAVKLMADGVLRGAGAMGSFMVATFTDLILRVILAYILSPVMGLAGIWSAWPAGWIVAMVLSGVFYFSGVWKRKWTVY